MGNESIWAWLGFLAFVVVLILIDLGLFSKKNHVIHFQEAALMSALWIGVALAFNGFVYVWLGGTAALEFFTGWLLEKSLSVDNLFVFVVIFSYFKVEPQYQRRVLVWGIIGALIMRAVFIVLGTSLVELTHVTLGGFHFNPILLAFGAFLIYTGFNLARENDENEPKIEDNAAVKILKRYLPLTNHYHGEKFSIIENGKRLFTPLVLVLAVIETTDLIFAVDSIPAIIGVTKDPFIVFTSNIMAILGLRALYFLLADVMDKFHYLKYSLAVILVFIGFKMVTEEWLLEGMLGLHKEQLAILTLIFVIAVLATGIVGSLIRKPEATSEIGAAED
ncbi:MAG: TerC family protein [Anaerolineales bacterium]|nr:TerC family protein [Anaerolineales bacterium]